MADQVSIPRAAAAALAPLLAAERRRARRNGADLPPRLLRTLEAFQAAEAALAGVPESVPPLPKPVPPPPTSSPVSPFMMVDARELTRRAGGSAPSVRRAARRGTRQKARRGTLPGRFVAGRWLFDLGDPRVQEWIGARVAKREQAKRADEFVEMRARRAELRERLGELDKQIVASEAEREAAAAIAETTRNPVARWRAKETHAAAVDRIAEICTERAPIEDRLRLLDEVLDPVEARVERIERQRKIVQAWEILTAVPTLMDKVIKLCDEAEVILRGTGEHVPLRLRDFARAWRDTGRGREGYGPARASLATNASVEDAKARLAALEAMP